MQKVMKRNVSRRWITFTLILCMLLPYIPIRTAAAVIGPEDAVQQSGNSVAYINYYGKGTALLYTPNYSGIKEDILLASYTGISSFSFLYTVKCTMTRGAIIPVSGL